MGKYVQTAEQLTSKYIFGIQYMYKLKIVKFEVLKFEAKAHI